MRRIYDQGYRLTNEGEGLLIEPTKLQPEALRLDLQALAETGLQLRDDHQIAYNPQKAMKGERLIESLVTTLERVSGLVTSQKEPAKWKWDLENLKKLQLLVAGLDEEGIAEVLDTK